MPEPFDPRRAAAALRALLKNPDDLPQVFVVIQSLTTSAGLERLRAGFERSPEGRRLLTTRPDITKLLTDRDRLRAMPEGSLGRAYLAFVEGENISADGIREASEIVRRGDPADAELQFVRNRMRDAHDLWHAVTGYQGDVLGELGLLAFTLAQSWTLGIGLILLAAMAKGIRHTAILRFVREGHRRGRQAAWLPSQPWESLLERPLDEVRALLQIAAQPRYGAMRTAELRAEGVVAPA